MSDPFAPDSHAQLIREAQRGLAIIGILGLIFGYIAIQRIRGDWNGIPEHVRNAPPSQIVWPYDQSLADRPKQQNNSRNAPFDSRSDSENDLDNTQNSISRTSQPRLSPHSHTPRTSKADKFAEKEKVSENKGLQTVVSSQVDDKQSQPFQSTYESRPELATFDSEENGNSSAVSDAQSQAAFIPSSNLTVQPKSPQEVPVPAQTEKDFQDQFKPLPSPTNAKPNGETKTPSALLPRDPFGFSNSDDKPGEGSQPAKRFEGIDFQPVPLPNTNKAKSQDASSGLKATGVEIDPSLQSISTLSSFNKDASPEPESRLNEKNLSGNPNLHAPKVNEPMSPGLTPIKASEGCEEEIEYVIKEGDNFWSIAQIHYEDGRYFRPLYEYNIGRVNDFESPQPGTKILIPCVAKLRRDYPALCKTISFTPREGDTRVSLPAETGEPWKIRAAQPIKSVPTASTRTEAARTYVTRERDNLFKIAAEELGQASRYIELIELNRSSLPQGIDDSTPLAQGLTLILP